jgi:PKD domain
MTRAARRRRLRAFGTSGTALLLGAGVLMALTVAGGAPPAAANPSGASPLVYVTASVGNQGRLAQVSLANVRTGGSVAPTPGDAPLGPVAVSATAATVFVGVEPPPAAVAAIPPAVAVINIATGQETSTHTAQAPDAIVADPTNPAVAYVLEGQGSSGRIDRVTVSANPATPPTDTGLVGGGQFAGNVCCSLSSLAISPDGQTLFVGEEGDGFGAIGVVPVANPAGAFEWEWPPAQRQKGVFLDSVADLVVAPNGGTLYATGPGNANDSTEGQVFAFSLPLTSPTQGLLWSHGLTSGTANPVLQLSVPTCITISPGGSNLEIGGNDGPSTISVVQSFSTAGRSPTRFQQVAMRTNANGAQGLRSIAFTPDGATVLVAGTDGGGTSDDAIVPLRASDLSVGPKTHLPVRTNQLVAQSLAVTPDQAPVAQIVAPSAVQVGHGITFDASSSTVAFGAVNRFRWDFGDGSGLPAPSSEVVSHVYTAPGTYQVTVTETDSAGTSIPPAVASFSVDGPGQTPYRRADPSARASFTVTVTTTPPTTHTSTPTSPTTGPTGTTTPSHGSTTTTTVKGQHRPGTPTLILNPAVGPPGTIVTVTGQGFRPNTPVTVFWTVSTGSVVVTADTHGNLPPRTLLILTPDILGPRFAEASSSPPATAPFLVVPSTSEPGGDDPGLLFRSEGP